jgi:transcriptional regulator GlxA family with amidase domain
MEADTQSAFITDADAVRGGQLSVMEYAASRLPGVVRLDRAIGKSEGERRPTQRRWREIEAFIEANLDMPLTVIDMAARTGLSVSHFSRAFSAALKMPPHAYLVERRLIRAQQLLASSNVPLAEIALMTGFADQSHLCRRFRENIGIPPSVFRRLHGKSTWQAGVVCC